MPTIIRTISRIYLVTALVAAAVLSPPFYSWVAMALLLLGLYSILRPPRAGVNLSLTLAILFLLPLMLEPLVETVASALFLLPALPLLDSALREQAPAQAHRFSEGTRATTTTKALAGAILAMLAISIIAWNATLAIASAIIMCYLIGLVSYIMVAIGREPLEVSEISVRVIAGETAEREADIKSKARMPLGLSLSTPYPWARLDPDVLTIRGEVRVSLTISPLLSGPSKLPFKASILDQWGLIEVGQELGPLKLYVIPRARYAEWLAKKYLEQTAPGAATTAVTLPPQAAPKGVGRGVEYHNSRAYQPGDRLKDIDWKHTVKLRELVVKEYAEAQGQAAILLVNLTARDTEEADLVVYSLITSALTLARDAIPAALAAYDQEKVLASTRILNPRETVKKALELAENMVLVEAVERFLQPPEVKRLRRAMGQLEDAHTNPSRRLYEILRMEYITLENAAKVHPLARALMGTIEHVPPPATITLVSPLNHDIDALSMTIERLAERGYNVITVPITDRLHQPSKISLFSS